MPDSLTNEQIIMFSGLTNITHMNEVLDNICVVRIVGTPEHARVREVRSKQEKALP
jgi:glutaminyl-peptide cyclotransferase